jgi:hypothetical protein
MSCNLISLHDTAWHALAACCRVRTGVLPGHPAAVHSATICSTALPAMSSTSVLTAVGPQLCHGSDSGLCALAIVSPVKSAPAVSGMPRSAAAAEAEQTPGTMSKGMSALESTATSDASREKNDVQPPFNRTTCSKALCLEHARHMHVTLTEMLHLCVVAEWTSPVRVLGTADEVVTLCGHAPTRKLAHRTFLCIMHFSTSSASISYCCIEDCPPRLPTKIVSAPGRQKCRLSSDISAS